jgi:hypothetical protein
VSVTVAFGASLATEIASAPTPSTNRPKARKYRVLGRDGRSKRTSPLVASGVTPERLMPSYSSSVLRLVSCAVNFRPSVCLVMSVRVGSTAPQELTSEVSTDRLQVAPSPLFTQPMSSYPGGRASRSPPVPEVSAVGRSAVWSAMKMEPSSAFRMRSLCFFLSAS